MTAAMGPVFLTAGNVTATRTVRLAETRPSAGAAPNQSLSAATETSSGATNTVTGSDSAGTDLTSFTVSLKVEIIKNVQPSHPELLSCPVLDCGGLEFRCASGECVHLSLRCNGRPDCQDGSDEACGCSMFCSGPREFLCHDNLCVTGPVSSPRCDGSTQCSDGSDEFSCPAAFCPAGEWRCETGHCIPAVHRCDGTSQCPDMSDEVGCRSCRPGLWACRDGQCVESQYRCDGVPHCEDTTDELECGNKSSHIFILI